MRSPKEMRLAQIDITNACVHSCSNCTRLCGNHNKNFYMSWEIFKKAVDSMEGFEGSVGIIGGEPLLHPEFDRFAKYLGSKIGIKQEPTEFIKPARDYMRRLAREELKKYTCYDTSQGIRDRLQGASVFTTVPNNYLKYFEVMHDNFRFMGINDHTLPSMHQPILISRKDLGITDEEWIPMRDACWVQNLWCTSITPKGAFFCEVAASLDMLFDGPGGWKIEKGWWERTPEEFGEQLKWCEICGLALASFSRDANEELDDMSHSVYEILKERNSPRIRSGKVNIVTDINDEIKKNKEIYELKKNSFSDSYADRLINCRKHLLPKSIVAGVIYDGNTELELFTKNLDTKCKYVDEIYVVNRSSNILEEADLYCANKKIHLINLIENKIAALINRSTSMINNDITIGRCINALRNSVKQESFVILTNEYMEAISDNNLLWKDYICNPGVIIYDDNMAFFNFMAEAFENSEYSEVDKVDSIEDLVNLYNEHKRLVYSDNTFADDEEEFDISREYIIYAAGGGGQKVYNHLKNIGAKVKFFGDSNPSKWGTFIDGIEIVSPQKVKEEQGNAIIVVATVLHESIIDMLVDIGINRNTIMISGWAL